MKLIRLKLLLFACLVLAAIALKTSTMTETASKSKTNSKTEAKTSIFSYDFLSVMKKKMRAMKEKEKLANTYQTTLNNKNLNKLNTKSNSSNQVANSLAPHLQPAVSSVRDDGSVRIPSSEEQEQADQDLNQDVKPSSENEEPLTPLSNSKEGPIYFSIWIKYFKFNDDDTHLGKPNSFFKNNMFYEQLKINPKLTRAQLREKGKDGLCKNIPGPTYFFASLFKDQITITQSRLDVSKLIIDSLQIDHITPVIEQNGFSGGIIDFGAFNEGYCFKLATVDRKTWIFCTKTAEDKARFMKAIKDVKLMDQRNKGLIVTPDSSKVDESLDNLFRATNDDKKKEMEQNGVRTGVNQSNVKDGYWIVLQDWSQCNKKCDGGVSTIHRLCIPPNNGGKPCEGEAIMTKPCNTQPCPKINGNDANSKKMLEAQKPVTLKPIIKVMRYSNRPQNYHKCIIKETDLMLTKEIEEEQNNIDLLNGQKRTRPIQVPVRAIMNNRTISFYENAEDFNTHAVTYNLKSADFRRSSRDKYCFVISEANRKTELCPIGIDQSGKDFDEWDRDFHVFKYNCKSKPDEMEIRLKDRFKEKMQEAKQDLLIERENMVKDKIRKKEQDNSFNILKQTNQVAQQAILKEENLEELIQKEEEERETREEIELKEAIAKEAKKNECIMHAIKERELENQYQIKTKETQKEVEQIKESAMKEVINKRNKLKDKISEMRKKAKRKSAKLKQALLSMKMKMASEMSDVYKDGDQGKCLAAIKDEKMRLNYCTANFDDIIKFSQCKDDDDFCQMCCEHEFGEMHMDHRNKCIKELCDAEVIKKEKAKGSWIWKDTPQEKKFGVINTSTPYNTNSPILPVSSQ